MSPALNKSLALQWFEHGDTIKIYNRTWFLHHIRYIYITVGNNHQETTTCIFFTPHKRTQLLNTSTDKRLKRYMRYWRLLIPYKDSIIRL